MRNQNLPPIKYMDGPPAEVRPVQIRYYDPVVMMEKAIAQAQEEDEAEQSELRQEMRENARPGSRMSFVGKEKADEQLFGPGLKGRTIGPDEEL